MIGADASGNANTGTLTNGPLWTSGKNGGALQFDGVNDLVRVNDADVLDLSMAATFEAWVYPTVALSGWRTILQKEVDAYIFAASAAGARRRAAGRSTACAAPTCRRRRRCRSTPGRIVAASYDGAQIRLYVNGVQVAAIAASGTYEQNANPLWIGGNALYGEHFTGQARRPAHLQPGAHAAEIQTDMNTPVGGTPPPDTTLPTVTITTPTSAATHTASATPLTPGRHGLGQRGGDAGHLEQRSGRQWHGDGHDELVGERDRAASGQNVLTVTARDAAGNTSTDTLTVTYTPPDTTLPTVTITTPTSAATHSASATPLSLGARPRTTWR